MDTDWSYTPAHSFRDFNITAISPTLALRSSDRRSHIQPSRTLIRWPVCLAFNEMIILARHGRTAFNEEGRYHGVCDSPLTALGLEQARRLGSIISTLTSDQVTLWSSPLGRAVKTAQIVKEVAGFDVDIVLDVRLREVSLGAWDGLTDEEIECVSPGACDGATRFDWFFRAPDGESFELAEERLGGWLAEVCDRPGCHVAIAHGLSGRILRGLYGGIPKSETLKLDVPQDAVFLLRGGKCEKIDA